MFVEHLALSNDCIRQFHRCAIQEHDIDPVGLEGTSQFVGETGPNTMPVHGPIDQYCQIIVAHGAETALDSGAEQIDQGHALEAG
jgi:hypothetical protein